MRISFLLLGVLCVFALLLLKSLFWSELDVQTLRQYQQSVVKQQADNEALQQENQAIYEKIVLLKTDPSYIEGLARRELGMIKQGEVFYQFATANEK